jgi:glycosyltransferase involved in cell wall biosynthesis
MRIAALVHFTVPFRNAGSETMLHAMLKRLKASGHEVTAIGTDNPDAPFYCEYDDIPTYSTNVVYARQKLSELKPDVIVTHHENTRRTANVARKLGIPWVFLMHNDFPETVSQLSLGPDLAVFNTDWVAAEHSHRVKNWTVIRPPVDPNRHRVTPGECVTLVNLSANKGAEVFYELARRMPGTAFLGVIGGHGEQILRDLPNVEIIEHTDNMRDVVWSKTRVLLMPSVYESYGMAGVEALASGIPVVAHPTPGLLESQGPEGVFADRNDVDEWHRALTRLLDSAHWKAASTKALERSAQLDPTLDLDRWADAIERLVIHAEDANY